MPLKILLADDSMTAQKMGKEILTTAGYEVIAVSNGAVAAKKLAEKPDIIILDVFMPGYTGLELCEKIRASMDLAKTPVLLTVGKMEPFRPEEGQKVKADGVIVKPFEASDLLAAVQKLAEKIREDAKPKKSGAYEKTMIFKAPQVIDEVKEDSGDWRTQAEHAGEAQGPPRLQMSSEMASAPAFGADLMGETSPSPTPSFEMPRPMAEATPAYSSAAAFDMTPPTHPVVSSAPAAAFDENVAFAQHASGQAKTRKRNTAEIQAGAAIAAAAANAPEPVIESPSVESLLERTSEPATPSSASSATAELETSCVISGAEIEVTPDPGLDRGYGDSVPAPGQDPALETDQTKMATEFATKFGTSEPEPPAPENVDAEFEARVAAAMSGYETQPDPALVADGSDSEKATVPQVEAAVTAPEISNSTPDYTSTPDYEDTQKIEAAVAPPEEAQAKAPEVQDPELAKLMQEAVAAVASPTTEANTAEEPVITAEVVVEESATKSPSSSDATAGAELANALAAAVGADVAPKANEIGDETTHRVVTRVLERMLPSIMTELAKEMEAAKNKK